MKIEQIKNKIGNGLSLIKLSTEKEISFSKEKDIVLVSPNKTKTTIRLK